jgi:hypothetical protein
MQPAKQRITLNAVHLEQTAVLEDAATFFRRVLARGLAKRRVATSVTPHFVELALL